MKTAFIILTSKCNRSCDFCYYNQDNFRRKKDTLTYQSIISTLNFFRQKSFNEVTFTGGEPLLKKNFLIQLIIQAKKLGYYTNIDTNATLLGKNFLRELERSGIDDIYISSENINSKILDLFKNSTIKPIIIAVITKNNLNKIQDKIRTIQKYNYEIILQPAYINVKSINAKSISLKYLLSKEKGKLIKIVRQWDKKNIYKKYQNLFLSFYGLGPKKYPHICHMGNENVVIDSDGSIFPCFHRQDLYCGNINNQKPDKIYEELTKTRCKLINASCFGEHCISLFYH
ncbi:MAG: radical SAM protein [Patescibacteria group bacterium]